MSPKFDRVLIANRGEIAVRIAEGLRRMGIESVAVHSDADAEAVHVEAADRALSLGGGPPTENYLAIDRIIDCCRRSGATALHPGYGFLAENATFAQACADAGITFIGPPPEVIATMGSKTRAREIMSAAGVPIVPGTLTPVGGIDEALLDAERIGYPIAAKAAGGGGGKGFRVAREAAELEAALEGARTEGQRFFGNDDVYMERYLEDPRHVEVQVVADRDGNVIHLGERDCSTQRRHQKLVEEAPAPLVDAAMRARIGQIAVDAARAVGYHSVGTIEGLLVDGEFFFLEMNTRLQVEHRVTELVTGIDLVQLQLEVAYGAELALRQEDVTTQGHAIECRINAESARKGFVPCPGVIAEYQEPAPRDWLLVDSGVRAGTEVTPFYDPLLAKVVVHAADRGTATERMREALAEFRIEGIETLVDFHRAYLATDEWAAGETGRSLLTDRAWLKSLISQPV